MSQSTQFTSGRHSRSPSMGLHRSFKKKESSDLRVTKHIIKAGRNSEKPSQLEARSGGGLGAYPAVGEETLRSQFEGYSLLVTGGKHNNARDMVTSR